MKRPATPPSPRPHRPEAAGPKAARARAARSKAASTGDAPAGDAPRLARRPRADAGETRERIFHAALSLFRKKGFDPATMRDIARAAGVSLGAAYHYFPSKQAIATELFRLHVAAHQRLSRGAIERAPDLAGRIRAALATGIEVRLDDRAALRAISRVVLDPGDEASLFADETADIREASVGILRLALEHDDVPPELRDLGAQALWALHLGLMLVFVRDESEGARDTLAFIGKLSLFVPAAIGLLGGPAFSPALAAVEALVREAAAIGRPRA